MPTVVTDQAQVLPPVYHRMQGRLGSNLYIDALTLVKTLHLLTLCRLAVHLAHRRCPLDQEVPPAPPVRHTHGTTYSIHTELKVWFKAT
jgi:hypothetical protein